MSDTYAIIEAGGHQVRVSAGDTVRVHKIEGKVGGKVTYSKVLLLAQGGKIQVGLPYVAGARVEAQITDAGLGKKVLVAKFKRRKKIRRLRGHRQAFTEIKIIKVAAGEPAAAKGADHGA